jgi:hypothetical protein
LSLDAESAGPLSILEVYENRAEYYDLYGEVSGSEAMLASSCFLPLACVLTQGLLCVLLRLALHTSHRGISGMVFSILASLRCHHVQTLADAALASDISAIIFQNIIHGDLESIVQAVGFGASLLSMSPDLYTQHFLRHGTVKEVALLHDHLVGGTGMEKTSDNPPALSSLARSRRPGSQGSLPSVSVRDSVHGRLVETARNFFAALRVPPAKEAATAGGGSKKRKRALR